MVKAAHPTLDKLCYMRADGANGTRRSPLVINPSHPFLMSRPNKPQNSVLRETSPLLPSGSQHSAL